MKVKFQVREKLYNMVDYEVESDMFGEDEEELKNYIDDLIYQFEDCGDSSDLAMRLEDEFGVENVKADGISGFDSIYPADCCELWQWTDPES